MIEYGGHHFFSVRLHTALCLAIFGRDGKQGLRDDRIAGNQVASCRRPVWKPELKTGMEQAAGHDAPALQHQFRFRAEEQSCRANHPARRGQPDRHGPRLT